MGQLLFQCPFLFLIIFTVVFIKYFSPLLFKDSGGVSSYCTCKALSILWGFLFSFEFFLKFYQDVLWGDRKQSFSSFRHLSVYLIRYFWCEVIYKKWVKSWGHIFSRICFSNVLWSLNILSLKFLKDFKERIREFNLFARKNSGNRFQSKLSNSRSFSRLWIPQCSPALHFHCFLFVCLVDFFFFWPSRFLLTADILGLHVPNLSVNTCFFFLV